MSRLLTVVRREYLERVRSKAYIVSTFLGPVLVVAVMLGPSLIMERQKGQPLRVAVVDETRALGPAVERALALPRVAGRPRFSVVPLPAGDTEAARRQARTEVVEGHLDGYLDLAADAARTSTADYYGRNVSNMGDLRLLSNAAEEALVEHRLVEEGLEGARVRALTRKLDLRTIRLTAGGEREDRGQSFILALLLLTLLYTTVAMWGAAIMNGVVEEKSNRVVEVIVSSIPTTHLFAGKLLGVGAAGLTQFLVWALAMAGLGAYGAAATGLPLPEFSPLLLVSFVVYFLLGYFLYGALYAAVGSAVNTPHEAQSLAFPVMMPLVLGFVFFPVVLGSPDGPLSVALSLVPFFTPMLMFLRICAVTPPTWQIVTSLVLTLSTVVLLTWAAARVYRVGILMHGKRPTFPEIVRWARMS
ncbi:MAG TPA: ABC transporter permease [Vicinamibacteria bacterium]|nr:ABC transporter permease [Vicinamibacteria bacterium]